MIQVKRVFVVTIIFSISLTVSGRANPGVSEYADFWNEMAQKDLLAALKIKQNENVAKNVILFVGDGMGVSTVTASRILKGQLKGRTGEEENLIWDTFPYSALLKTYGVNRQTVDSAQAATALLCGVKANAATIGVDSRVERAVCDTQNGAEVKSILDWSMAEGKSVGIVTTARVTHATPAAAYAHSVERNWESDAHMPNMASGCTDIADQLITDNKNIQVILGGGRRSFIPYNESDPVTQENHAKNGRRDGRNLIEEWEQDKMERKLKYKLLYQNKDIQTTNTDDVEYLLGLFSSGHMDYELERDNSTDGQPSLTEMMELALKVLKKRDKGFFILVEAGRIDHAHHDSLAKKALYETLEFDKAVEKALAMTDEENTLIVVTADHSHVFVIGGYPSRGNDIIGLTDDFGIEFDAPPSDNKPSTTLLYGNGPGHNATHPRQNLTGVDVRDNDYVQQSAVPMADETHGGEDISVFARGPMSHLFHGVREQNYITHVMAYASCVGQNKDHCKKTSGSPECEKTSGSSDVTSIRPLDMILLAGLLTLCL